MGTMQFQGIFWRHNIQNAKLNLTQWNDYLFGLYIPLDVLFGMFIVIGIFGNGAVLYVHSFKIIKRKDGEYFIPYLASVDLVGCIVCSSFALSRTLRPVTYDYEVGCKVGTFLSGFTIYFSMFLLFAIACQRYAKICKGRGFIERSKRWSLLLFISFLAVVLALPTLATTGCVPFYSKFRDATGQICATLPGTAPFMYDVILILVIPLCCIVFLLLYFVIAMKITRSLYAHRRTNAIHQSTDVITSVSKHVQNSANSTITKHNKQIRGKITMVFTFITLSFIMCTLPKAILMIFENFTENFWHEINDKERVLLLFINEGYILFFVINPFIYAFLDSSFRTHLRGVKKIRMRKTASSVDIPEPVWDSHTNS